MGDDVLDKSGTYESAADGSTSVETGWPSEGRSNVANALADLLQLGSAALDPQHAAMKRAAATLPAHWRTKGGQR